MHFYKHMNSLQCTCHIHNKPHNLRRDLCHPAPTHTILPRFKINTKHSIPSPSKILYAHTTHITSKQGIFIIQPLPPPPPPRPQPATSIISISIKHHHLSRIIKPCLPLPKSLPAPSGICNDKRLRRLQQARSQRSSDRRPGHAKNAGK